MQFNIGEMRTRVAIERRGSTQDAAGEQSSAWAPLLDANNAPILWWVSIEALTGRELEAAQAVRATDSHTITMRYLAGFSAKDRMVYTDPEGTVHYFNITDVIDGEYRHRYMQCTAVEGLADG